ncbi:MAG: hypothetical protein WBM17_13420 [Anaerolineales bacterium]
MKKSIAVSVIIFIVVMLSVGIVDNMLMLSNDINTHTWLSLIGRWQSYEKGFYEIEFKPDGTFIEYYHGIAKNSGVFRVSGKTIVFLYDPSNCDHENEKDCTVDMEFDYSAGTLILKTNNSRTVYKRLKDQ